MSARDNEDTILLRVPLDLLEETGRSPTAEALEALGGAVYLAYTRCEPHLVRCERTGCPNEFVRRSATSLKRYCRRSCAVMARRSELRNKQKYEAALDRIQKMDKEKFNGLLGD
ncbi:MAG: hypothetical protein WCI05_13670 [Myxococcales bacterium]